MAARARQMSLTLLRAASRASRSLCASAALLTGRVSATHTATYSLQVHVSLCRAVVCSTHMYCKLRECKDCTGVRMEGGRGRESMHGCTRAPRQSPAATDGHDARTQAQAVVHNGHPKSFPDSICVKVEGSNDIGDQLAQTPPSGIIHDLHTAAKT